MAAPDALDVRRLRRSALLAGIGDGMAAVALPLLAAGITRDPLAVAGVVAAQHLPWALLALASPFLRQRDRRTLAGAGGSVRAVAMGVAGISAVVGDETILTLLAVAFALGVAQALGDDAERVGGEALTSPDDIDTTASLAAAGMLGLGLVGLPLGGFLYELLAPVPLLVDVGVYAVAALLVLMLGHPLVTARPSDAGGAPSLLPTLQRGTGTATAAASLTAAATGAVAGVLVLIALEDLGLGAPAFGLLLAGLAASTFVGAHGAPVLAGVLGTRAATVVALVVTAGALTAAWYLLDPELPILSVIGLGIAAGAAMAAGVLLRAQLHGAAHERLGDDGLRAFHLAVWTATPVGALLGGVAARPVGTGEVLLGAAAVSVAAAVVAGLVAPHSTADALPPHHVP